MCRRITTLLAMLAVLVVGVGGAAWVLVAPPSAKAEFPGQNGRIVFWREDSDGFVQTWVADKDLSDQAQLTSESADSGWAVWKPGGAKLAFDSNRADPDPNDSEAINDIFKMNPDGTGVVKLTDSKAFNSGPGWSPDGRKIAFESDRANNQGRPEIHVMDSDGTDVRRVTTLPADAIIDSAPRFSPDGSRIVFTRYITDPGRSALFTVRVDGGGLKQLTPWGNGAADADYSPDGKKLVFEAYPNKGCFGEIYTMDSDGRHLTNIAGNRCQAGSADPVWSPDGTKILFLSAHAEGGEFGIGLATMNPDGSERHHITPNPGWTRCTTPTGSRSLSLSGTKLGQGGPGHSSAGPFFVPFSPRSTPTAERRQPMSRKAPAGKNPMLETERLVLRPLSADEEDSLHRISNEPDVRLHLWDNEPVSEATVKDLIAQSDRMLSEEKIGVFGVRMRGSEDLLGFCGFVRLEGMQEPEIWYELTQKVWGRGIATEAAGACVQYAFEEVDMERVIAGADAPNTASLRVIEKLGMRYLGNINASSPEVPYFVLYREEFFAAIAEG